MEELNTLLNAMNRVGGVAVAMPVGMVLFALSAWACSSVRGRWLLLFTTVLVFALAQTNRGGEWVIPPIIGMSAMYLKWVILTCIFGAGLAVLATGRMRFSSTNWLIMLLIVPVLIRSLLTTDQLRFAIWAAMWLLVPILSQYAIYGTNHEWVIRWWKVASAFVAVAVLIAMLVSPNTAWENGRLRGFVASPNPFGVMAMLMLFPWVYGLFTRRLTLNAIGVIVWSVFLLLTGARGAVVGMIPLIVYVAVRLGVRPAYWIGSIAVVFGLALAYAFFVPEEIASRFEHATLENRLDLWSMGWDLAIKNPFVGVGMYADEILHTRYGADLGLHNSYLYVLVFMGFPLAILFFTLFTAIVVREWRHCAIALPHQPQIVTLCRLTILLLIGLCLNAAVEGWIHGIGSFILVAFLVLLGIRDGLVASGQLFLAQAMAWGVRPSLDSRPVV